MLRHSAKSLSELLKTKVAISQAVILNRCSRFLSLEQDKASPDLRESCFAFAVLTLYSVHLELTQLRKLDNHTIIARDDWRWLKSAFTRLSVWNLSRDDLYIKTKSARLLRKDTNRLIYHILHLQCETTAEKNLQMKIHEYLHDTTGQPFIQEYTFAGIFTASQLSQAIQVYIDPHRVKETSFLSELIQERRLIFINTYNHTVGVIKYYDYYLFYDTNEENGWLIFHKTELPLLAIEIFRAFNDDTSISLAFNFIVLSRKEDKRHIYPSHLQLSHALKMYESISQDNLVTALYMAADVQCLPSMRYYLVYPPLPVTEYVNLPTHNGRTALHVASLMGFVEGMELLLEKGADPNKLDIAGSSPLHAASAYLQFNAVKLLLAHGVNVNQVTQYGASPLHHAVAQGDEALTKLLLDHGAYVNQEIFFRAIPIAIEKDNTTIIDLLLAHQKINVNQADSSGKRFLSKVISRECINLIHCLLDEPTIIMTQTQYDKLLKLSGIKKSARWMEAVEKAQFILLLNVINNQVSKLTPGLRKRAYQKIADLRVRRQQEKLSIQEAMQLLLHSVLRVFYHINLKNLQQIWGTAPLASPVLALAKQFNIPITPDESQVPRPFAR